MKIAICGSLTFIEEMREMQKKLEEQGHHVEMPQSAIEGQSKEHWNSVKSSCPEQFSKIYGERMKLHFSKIHSSDAVLVLNYEKHGKENYIGPSTFLEMGFAFGAGKKIFTINPLPQDEKNDELVSINPICLHNKIEKLNDH